MRGDEKCWVEGVIALLDDDTQEEGVECLKRQGWVFNKDGTCVCPFCSRGIEEELNLKRVK